MPEHQGEAYDVGNAFRESAEARTSQIRNSEGFDPDRDEVVVIYAPTEESFLDTTNSKYESGGIVSLDVYSHGTANSISLGGEASDKDKQEEKGWVSVQDVSEDTESPLKNEFTSIDASNFSSSPRCTLWGCNQGGDDSSRKAKSLAQALVNQVGGTTKAFVGGGGAEFKQQNGKNIYDGTMIRSADRKS